MNHSQPGKTTEEEIDWKLLDQLHAAVGQISSFCFEVKKFCVTTLFAAITPAFRKDDTPLNCTPGGLMERINASLQRGGQS